ncbi:hypothetical protein U8C35_06485 [Sinorhizobium medicae]|uniref:hypothetical protein n=1 Tax=Sinorhizobium medicae TaxID=110321 RepID=UPI002AF6A44F|nr:hypothetical protein [Sinorhizobium medicae]WQO60080.1 hypothetical protein U8C35_06485 [Sinorhizobium medicae]
MKNLKLFYAALLTTTALTFFAAEAEAQVANVTPTTVAISGTNVTGLLANASGVMYVPNDGRSLLVLRGGGTAVTATVVTQKTGLFKEGYGNIPLSNETVSVPSASTVLVGPFPAGRFNTNTGVVAISMSSVTGVSATAVKLPQ